MKAWTRPTFCRFPFERARSGRSRSSSRRSASPSASSEVAHRAQAGEEDEELARGQRLVEAQVAGQVPDAAPDCDVAARVAAEELEASPRRPKQVENQPDRGRLAGPVRPEEPEHLAGRDLEVEVDDAALASVELRQPAARMTGFIADRPWKCAGFADHRSSHQRRRPATMLHRRNAQAFGELRIAFDRPLRPRRSGRVPCPLWKRPHAIQRLQR